MLITVPIELAHFILIAASPSTAASRLRDLSPKITMTVWTEFQALDDVEHQSFAVRAAIMFLLVFPFFTVLFGYDVIGALGNELCTLLPRSGSRSRTTSDIHAYHW